MRWTRLAGIFAFAASASSAYGAGYGLKEHSADAMAAAYAGAAATDSDASYLAYNPASLGGVNDWDISVDAIGILSSSSATYSTALTSAGTPTGGLSDPKSFIGSALVPGLALRKRLSERWAVGLTIGAPWGLSTSYPATWAGRYYALTSRLATYNGSPTLSYQLTPQLTVGAGLQVEYAKGTLTSAIDLGTLGAVLGIPGSAPGAQDGYAKLAGSNWNYGFTLGALAKVTPDLTLGLSYRSAIAHKLTGPLNYTLDSAGIGAVIRSVTGLFTDTQANATLNMPDVVSLGGRENLSDRWTALFEVDWTNWSKFHELSVNAANPVQPPDLTAANWHDTYFGSLGVEYRHDDRWTFRAGTAYDQSPVPDSTRGPRIPDTDRIWLSAGASYKWSDTTDIKLTGGHLFNLQTNIARDPTQLGNSLRGTLAGTTNSYVNVVGLQIVYRD